MIQSEHYTMPLCISSSPELRDMQSCHVCRCLVWFDSVKGSHAQTCFLSPPAHWPSASSCATDMRPSCVIECACEWVWRHTWEVKCISSFVLSCSVAPAARGRSSIICVFVLFFLHHVVTSATHSAALPCQQDKTAVIKTKSTKSPDSSSVPLVWFTNRISAPFTGHSLSGSGNPLCSAW